MNDEESTDIEFHFCEGCGQQFPLEQLKAESVLGPYFCELCRGDVRAEREHYAATNIWVNKNR